MSEKGMFHPVARLPQSWFDLTKLRLGSKVYALENDKEELYITVTSRVSEMEIKKIELEDTRAKTGYYVYCVANLVQLVLTTAGCPADMVEEWYVKLRRKVNCEVLEEISVYLDKNNKALLAIEFDSLRARMENFKPSTLETYPPASTPEPTRLGSMTETVVSMGNDSSLTKRAREKPLGLKDVTI